VTFESIATILASVVALVVALTTLVVQTQRLIAIAERYMQELAKQNVLQAVQVAQITGAIVGNSPTPVEVVPPADKSP
jgi:hypothetical protein